MKNYIIQVVPKVILMEIVHGVQEIPFAHGEIHPDGVNGGNGGQRRGAEIGRAHV